MKKIIFILLITFAFSNIKAQMFSPQQVVSDNADNSQVVNSADINQDGFIDLFSSSINDSKIAFYLFDEATGTFGEENIISTNTGYCVSLFPADLDGDNFPDLLAVSEQNSEVIWFKNSGSGSFTLQTPINSNAQNASSVIAVDIDNDGDLDVVSASKGDNKVLWYENDGSGNFSTPNIITTNAEIPVVVISADINNDNYQDIIAGYAQTDKIVYFTNNGNGTFSSETILTTQADLINSLRAADLNKDNKIDIISASKGDNKVAWYKNIDANGTFSDQIIISDQMTVAFDIEVGDFDLDNDIDVICSANGDDKIILFENTDGKGNFTFNQEVSYLVENVNGLNAGDYDNDGDIDISAASSADNKIVWFENGKENFLFHNINNNHIVTSVDYCDINNDGNIDIFYSSHTGIYVVGNYGNGVFSKEVVLYEDGHNYNNIFLVDLDGDGDKDLYATDWLGDEVIWFRNEGGGAFGSVNFIESYGSPDNAAPWGEKPMDFDNDGDLDLIISMVGLNQFYLYTNDGNGNFTKTLIIDNLASQAFTFSDVDNDGKQDIIIGENSYDSPNLLYYKNNGDGTFTSSVIHENINALSIITADLTNDGYEDIIYSSLFWMQNNQDETFGNGHEIEIWGYGDSMSADDMDNDGDIDFVTGYRGTNSRGCVYYCENINAGDTIIAQLPINVIGNAEEVTTADLNNDGWIDIVIGSWPDEGLYWAENYQYRILINPFDQYACEGEKAYFSVVSTGVEVYKWQINTGSGFEDIENNETYSGADKAQLVINNFDQSMEGNEFRCLVYDKKNEELITDTANLYKFTPSIECIDDQEIATGTSNVYTVYGDEFDLQAINNKCNQDFTITNDYNNSSSLAGAMFPIGNYTIVWQLKNSSNEVIDECSFELSVQHTVGIENNLEDEISIYPNPTTGIFTINNGQLIMDNIITTDITGKTIYSTMGHVPLQIDISNQPAGIYFIKIQTENNIIIKKIVKK